MAKKSNLFLLVGDPALREEARESLIPRTEGDPGRVEWLRYYGDDLKLDEFIQQAHTYPFLSSPQCILLSRPELLSKADLNKLAERISEIPDFTLLVCESDGLDKRSSFYKTFAKCGQIQEHRLDQAAQLERTVGRFLTERGKRIKREAFLELLERLGGSVVLIYQALEQITTFVGERKDITTEDVVTFVEREAPYGPFELADALSERNTEKCLSIYRFLMEHVGQQAVELVGLLSWQIRRLWDVQRFLASGKAERDLARALAIPPFAVRKLAVAARRFTARELREACDGLFYLDWKMKTGRVKGSTGLEDFLLGWCGSELAKRDAYA